MPSHATPPPPLTLSPGQSLWLCLPPGSTLHTSQGSVAVCWAPTHCGQALHTPPHTMLEAGEHLAWSGQQAQAAWVQLHNPSRSIAAIHLTEGTPAPSLGQRTWHWLRGALNGRKKPVKDLGYRSALNAMQ